MIEFWNERYAEETYAYGTAPNDFFREQLAKLSPATLLLPGEGEGRNAVHAARAGWNVHAVDFSAAGQRKAYALAEQSGVHLTYTVADLEDFDAGQERFDCVALLFVHLPETIRRRLHRRLAQALRPGGTLLLEAFTPEQLHFDSGGPRDTAMLYTEDMLSTDFQNLQRLHIDTMVRTLHEGPFHEGPASVIQLAATRAVDT